MKEIIKENINILEEIASSEKTVNEKIDKIYGQDSLIIESFEKSIGCFLGNEYSSIYLIEENYTFINDAFEDGYDGMSEYLNRKNVSIHDFMKHVDACFGQWVYLEDSLITSDTLLIVSNDELNELINGAITYIKKTTK